MPAAGRPTLPSPSQFNAMTAAAFDALPAAFRTLCADVILHTPDYADPETLDALGIDDPLELTGLYEGVDVTRKSATDPGAFPDHVYLYRRPILEEWIARGDVTLSALITHVLVHEIGHHFGLSDEQMHAIEADSDDPV